ncbi:MAG: hypothetical protein PUC59_04095 [Firmicutes bacterium]|nr:hypothetical protein [Bacillota bacterium]
MNCSTCGNEMAIVGSRIAVEGDTSPAEETRVFRVLQFACRNPHCAAHGKTEEERILISGGEVKG